jgi:hypothetical protein
MSARLKGFLDRTTCMQNHFCLGKPGLTDWRIVGILVNGHEDGAMKTSRDIYLNFQQMGFVMAPFGIWREFNSSTNAEFFRNDELVKSDTKGVVNNIIELMKLDIEGQMKGKLAPVSE